MSFDTNNRLTRRRHHSKPEKSGCSCAALSLVALVHSLLLLVCSERNEKEKKEKEKRKKKEGEREEKVEMEMEMEMEDGVGTMIERVDVVFRYGTREQKVIDTLFVLCIRKGRREKKHFAVIQIHVFSFLLFLSIYLSFYLHIC